MALLNRVWEKVDRIVEAEFTGNRSAYFAQLVRRDLLSRGITDKTHTLVVRVQELAREFGAEAVEAKLAELAKIKAEAELAEAGAMR